MKMKISMLVLLAMLLGACNQSSQKASTEQASTEVINPDLKLQVVYFHATNRCMTCNSIEQNVKAVLENNYKNEIESGVIGFKVLNIDEEANKQLADRYQAFGASLHLVEFENGQEINHDFTQFAFLHSLKNPETFLQGMNDTIKYYLDHTIQQ